MMSDIYILGESLVFVGFFQLSGNMGDEKRYMQKKMLWSKIKENKNLKECL